MPSATTAKFTDVHAAEAEAAERTQAAERELVREVARDAPARAQSLEERVAVIEATHATSVELGEARSALIKWVLFAAIGVAATAAGLLLASHSSTNARIDHVNTRIDQLQSDTNARFDQVNARLDSAVSELRAEIRATNNKLDRLIERMDAKFERMDAKFERMDARLREQDAKFEKIDARFKEQDVKLDAIMAAIREQQRDSR